MARRLEMCVSETESQDIVYHKYSDWCILISYDVSEAEEKRDESADVAMMNVDFSKETPKDMIFSLAAAIITIADKNKIPASDVAKECRAAGIPVSFASKDWCIGFLRSGKDRDIREEF